MGPQSIGNRKAETGSLQTGPSSGESTNFRFRSRFPAGYPKVALVAVVHALALDCLTTPLSGSCVNVTAKMTYLASSAEGIDDSPAYKLFAATSKAATKGMPKQPEKLWAWLMAKDQKGLLAILAVCAACTVDAVEKRRGADDGLEHAAQL